MQMARTSAFDKYLDDKNLEHTGLIETSEEWKPMKREEGIKDLIEYTFFIKYEDME